MSASDNQLAILQYSGVISKGVGDDKYILSENTIADGANIQLSDTFGLNTLQLHGGLTVTSSQVASNGALLLSLSNGAKVTILGASEFQFEIGGSALSGVAGEILDFDAFVNRFLGVNVPSTGVVSSAAPFTIPAEVTSTNSGAFIDDAAIVNIGSSYAGEIIQSGTIAWHEVQLQAGLIYQIDAVSKQDAQFGQVLGDPAIVSIYDTSGRVLTNTFDDDSGEGKNARVYFEPTQTGTYFIPVTNSLTATQQTTGEYELLVTATEQKVFVEAGAGSNDFNITFDDYVVEGKVDTQGQKDTYLIQATSGGEITLTFTHPDGVGIQGERLELSLYDASGESVLNETRVMGSGVFHTTVDRAGTYILEVADDDYYASGVSQGTYKVAMAFDSQELTAYDGPLNGSMNNADDVLSDGVTPISFDGHTLKGRTFENGDKDYFKVQASSGGEITLDFTHPQGIGSQGIRMELALYSQDGEFVLDRILRGNETLHTTISHAGMYFVKVADYSATYNNYDYTDTVYQVDMQFSSDNIAYDGSQNNSMNDALRTLSDGSTPITFDGSVIKGGISEDDEMDYFAIEASAGGEISLDFSHPDGLGNQGARMIVALYDQDGNAVLNRYVQGNESLVTSVSYAGTYFLKVEEASTSRNDFSKDLYEVALGFMSESVAYDGPSNNSMNTAIHYQADSETLISFNSSTIKGSFSHDEDVDYFAIEADFTGAVQLDFIHPQGAGSQGQAVDITLYDQNGTELFDTRVQGNATLGAELESNGVYFVGISDVRSSPDAFAEGYYQLDLSYA